MKFLLEFVSCWGNACRSNSVITAAEDRKLVSLYAGTVPMMEHKHRRTTSMSSRSGRCSAAGDHQYYWRPALKPISEDRPLVSVVVAVDRELENYGSHRLGKKQKVANSPRKIIRSPAPPHHSFDDFMIRRAPFGATVPTFSPTPFFL